MGNLPAHHPIKKSQKPARIGKIVINLFLLVVFTLLLAFIFFVFREIPVFGEIFRSSSYPELSILLAGLLVASAGMLMIGQGNEISIAFSIFKYTFNPNIKNYFTGVPPFAYLALIIISVILLVGFFQNCEALPLEFDVSTFESLKHVSPNDKIELPVGSNLTIYAKSPSTSMLSCHWDGQGTNLAAPISWSSCKNTLTLTDQPGQAIFTVQARAGLCRTKTVSMIIIKSQ